MRVYIEQYGYWWSTNATGWRALVDHALANDGEYSLDEIPALKALMGRPATVRVDESTGRTRYIDIAGHAIHQPLDWTLRDWEWALGELGPKGRRQRR